MEIQIQKKGHADKTDAVHLSKMTIFSGTMAGIQRTVLEIYIEILEELGDISPGW